MDFSSLDSDSLKLYLGGRWINTTGYKTQSLVKLATGANDIAVEIDPDDRETAGL